jgi:hypothetical protein
VANTGTTTANLFIAGAAKCGTSAWHRYLGAHPDIFFPEMKEPNYFALDLPRMRVVSSASAYEKLFRRGRTAKYRGEASCLYLYSKEAARAIHDYNPDAKILLFLRAQEYFLPSYHHQLQYRFAEPIEDFAEAWRLSGKRPAGTIPPECPDPALLDYASRGDFRTQVERFYDAFAREQILVIDFDDWTADPRAAYLQILDFLGLPDDGRTVFPPVNEARSFRSRRIGKLITNPPKFALQLVMLLRKLTGKSSLGIGAGAAKLFEKKGYRSQVPPELREEIRRRYAKDNEKLAALLGKPWSGAPDYGASRRAKAAR